MNLLLTYLSNNFKFNKKKVFNFFAARYFGSNILFSVVSSIYKNPNMLNKLIFAVMLNILWKNVNNKLYIFMKRVFLLRLNFRYYRENLFSWIILTIIFAFLIFISFCNLYLHFNQFFPMFLSLKFKYFVFYVNAIYSM